MAFKFAITADTGEVGKKAHTFTFSTIEWWIRAVRLMSVFAFTTCSPLVHVEAFPTRQPILTDFFWSSWNELELFTWAV